MIKSVSFRFPCCFVSSLPVFSIIRHLIATTERRTPCRFSVEKNQNFGRQFRNESRQRNMMEKSFAPERRFIETPCAPCIVARLQGSRKGNASHLGLPAFHRCLSLQFIRDLTPRPVNFDNARCSFYACKKFLFFFPPSNFEFHFTDTRSAGL